MDSALPDLPVIDLDLFREAPGSPAARAQCHNTARALEQYGAFLVRDSDVGEETLAEMLELFAGSGGYFAQSQETKARDETPEHQYGWTGEFTERSRDHDLMVSGLMNRSHDNLPIPVVEADAKERLFIPLRYRNLAPPPDVRHPKLNPGFMPPPAGFSFDRKIQWTDTLERFGSGMLETLFTISTMAAWGFGAEPDLFTRDMMRAPHLIAPTGSDLGRRGTLGTVLAGVHYDLNFLSLHGPANFPGLRIWDRRGRRIEVRVPPGHLLAQAGYQFWYQTGGAVHYGWHEVVVTEATIATIARARTEGKSLIRCTTTMFGHRDTDAIMKPVGPFRTIDAVRDFPAVVTGDYIWDRITNIGLV